MEVYGLEFSVIESRDNKERVAININHAKYYKPRKPNLEALKDVITRAGLNGMGNDLEVNL